MHLQFRAVLGGDGSGHNNEGTGWQERGKAGTKNCLFKIQILDFFQPVPAASLAGKRGEMAWCKCTGKESGAEWGT